jgi:nucleoside-diphosphate-sugar epimerase
MRVLVTGGAGFIGSNLCESLLGEGHIVLAYDNLLTGRLANLDELREQEGFSFVEGDTQTMPQIQIDAVFHLASPASPVGYGLHPIETLLSNAEGTRRVLDVTRAAGARFLITSTSEIYGDPLEHPQSEGYFGNVDPVGPRSCYDEGKRYAEALTVWYGREYGMDVRIVRIFNCYGPKNAPDDGRIVPTFISQALHDEPITVYGDGSQTRSLCYVSDLVDGLKRAMFTPGTRDRIYNLGNPEEHSVLEYAEIIRELSGSRSPIVHEPGRPGEIARRKPNIDRARQELGWQPLVDLREGLGETIAWFRTEILAGARSPDPSLTR